MDYAEVSVNAAFAGRQTFSYRIPQNIEVQPGHAVWVPFGARLLQGMVVSLSDIPSVPEIKEIDGLIGTTPLLNDNQLTMARWLSDYYLAPLFDCISLMLPPDFLRKSITCVAATEKAASYDKSTLNEKEFQLLQMLGNSRETTVTELEQKLGKRAVQNAVNHLVTLNIIRRSYQIQPPTVKAKLELYANLAISSQQARDAAAGFKSKKQALLLDFLTQQLQPVAWRELREKFGFTRPILNALVEKGFISLTQVRVNRDPITANTGTSEPPLNLSPTQQHACDEIKTSLHQENTNKAGKVFLLHGVTGSGKTEIYLQALAETIRIGKRGIVLVPEISLTPQTIERFSARFPGKVAVIHSRLSLGERFDEWQRIQNGEFSVVIGARSAIFSPLSDLGLIVLDEEHDWSYKQHGQNPRYHTRKVAEKLAALTGATLVLGSATPDIESYNAATRGEYQLLSLPERISPHRNTPLPPVEIIDLREELKAGNSSLFSRTLSRLIQAALDKKEQVILFLNRRGSAFFVQCRHCGHVWKCPRCQIPLTHHQQENALICHQCNYHRRVPFSCPVCTSSELDFIGSGIQKLEKESAEIFPHARLLRWDSDSTRNKNAGKIILKKFTNHEADILIGTQLVTSGLDLPAVTLVGIINIDGNLNIPDPRAGERTFQLLSQVAGRTGRGVQGGCVILQTFSPTHYAVVAAAHHDYISFYQQELSYRKMLRQPPFSKLMTLTYSNKNLALCRRETAKLKQEIINHIAKNGITDLSIIGPAPAFIKRRRGLFRWQITLRGYRLQSLVESITLPRGWIIDMDPLGFD